MKKFLLSILTLMYMAMSSGIAMEIHYCMGERAGADFYGTSSGECGRCGMKEQKKSGCCHDDQHFFKLEDSHKKAVNDISFSLGEAVITHTFPLYDQDTPSKIVSTVVQNNSPPGYLKPPARILHGVFRI